MKKQIEMYLVGLFIVVIAVITISLAVKSCQLNKDKNLIIEIENEIQKTSDSVGLDAIMQPDTTKLRKLQALKLRIATAQYYDSLQRAENK
jgi:hypothetical protein